MKEKQRKLLIELRSTLIGKLHTQPYTIYKDETIEHLLEAQPKTIEELGKVKGFPPDGKRIKGFGEAVIDIFNNWDKLQGFAIEGDSEKDATIKTMVEKVNAF